MQDDPQLKLQKATIKLEEKFYVIFTLALICIWSFFFGFRWCVLSVLAIAVITFAIMAWKTSRIAKSLNKNG
jgi:peptidoglycan/LPS O-acetylase OafA/YrhL